MKNFKSIVKVIAIILILQFVLLPTTSQAGIFDNIFNSADNFIAAGQGTTVDESKLKEISNDVFSILFYIGMAIAVIVGGVLGIQFMMASAEDKAKIKEAMIPYVVGCVVVFGAFGIWKLAITVLNNI